MGEQHVFLLAPGSGAGDWWPIDAAGFALVCCLPACGAWSVLSEVMESIYNRLEETRKQKTALQLKASPRLGGRRSSVLGCHAAGSYKADEALVVLLQVEELQHENKEVGKKWLATATQLAELEKEHEKTTEQLDKVMGE